MATQTNQVLRFHVLTVQLERGRTTQIGSFRPARVVDVFDGGNGRCYAVVEADTDDTFLTCTTTGDKVGAFVLSVRPIKFDSREKISRRWSYVATAAGLHWYADQSGVVEERQA